MAAEFISRKTPSRCIFFFDRAMMGRWPRTPGPLARMGIVRMPMALDVRTKGRYLRMCLPIGTMAPNEETKTSVRRRFWAALQTKSVLACVPQMGVPEIKSNRSHPLLCRDAVWRTWSITTVLDRLRRSTISPAILIWQRLVHQYRV
jgi:hypothetical protein